MGDGNLGPIVTVIIVDSDNRFLIVIECEFYNNITSSAESDHVAVYNKVLGMKRYVISNPSEPVIEFTASLRT